MSVLEELADADGLPDTDALRNALRCGVDLDRLSRVAAGAGIERHGPAELPWWSHESPQLRCDDRPIAEVLAGWGTLVLPVLELHRTARVLPHAAPLVEDLVGQPAALVEQLLSEVVDFVDCVPGMVEDLRVIGWPVAPRRHRDHAGHRCVGQGGSCFSALAAHMARTALWMRECFHGEAHLVAPPLLVRPPGVTRRQMRRIEAELGVALAGTVKFAPGPFAGPSL